MISKSVLQNYLQRERDSFDWVKEVREKDLDEIIDALKPIPDFSTVPYKHQKACFLIGINNPQFLYFVDLGLGKTKLVLDLSSYYYKCGELRGSVLVLVPNYVNIGEWGEQVQMHASGLSCIPLLGSGEERWQLMKEDADIYIINYQGLLAMVSSKKKSGKGWAIDVKKINKIVEKFDGVIFDESTAFKNRNSMTFRMCDKIAKNCYMRYALTGTPFGRDPTDLWSQFYVIDRGETLGPTLGFYREVFFTKRKSFFGYYEYVFNKKREKNLYKIMKHKSIYYNEEECQSLPEKVPMIKRIGFPIDTYQYYKEIMEEVRLAGGDPRSMESSFVKMRQLASGFMTFKGEDGAKVEIEFDSNPKLEMTIDLIENLPPKRKMVIFHEFIYTGQKISDQLKKMKIGHERLWSGTKDSVDALRRFKKDPKCRILVVNNKSGAFGLNLQIANYVIFYETPVSPMIRRQTEKRCHRGGQKRRTFYYDLVMKNSVDQKIYRYLKEGKDLFNALMKGEETLDIDGPF